MVDPEKTIQGNGLACRLNQFEPELCEADEPHVERTNENNVRQGVGKSAR